MALLSVPSVSPGNARGLGEKLFGVVEEIAGSVVGNDSLKKRGQTLQKAGEKRLSALQHQLNADKEEAKASSSEAAQRSAQRSKEASA